MRGAAIAALALSGMMAAFATIAPTPSGPLLIPGKFVREAFPVPGASAVTPGANFQREARLGRGETLGALLNRLGVDDTEARKLLRLDTLRQLRPGGTLRAQSDAEGRLLGLSASLGRESALTITPEGNGYRVSKDPLPLQTVTLLRGGEIRSSLFAATDAADIPDAIAIQLAEMFGGDIDFHRDLRRGDRFSVVYEMHYHLGRPVQSGRVLAAEFINRKTTLRAVYYVDARGKGGYYAPDGKNLRKAFLRSPLEFSRVSSRFGMRRHPFLKTWRAHRGVDYAAPSGTRVRAVGDGVVDFAGTKGGYGKVVILRHHGGNSTLYAHLRGFAKGIRRGARVSQGETIASVGSTGWATGPHLHYEFRVAGVARNPLAMTLPAALPIPRDELARYRRIATPLVAQLELLVGTQLAALQ
ncbi:MAG: M23 family metallopeptidase [Proteobacteria bacterium]|nr:M23 family metallopeptidase [Pseudomonadota bacterium]